VIHLQQKILARNQYQAEQNRRWFAERRILALNLVSAPGAGKTTLLERTIRDLGTEVSIHVIEGDQATDHDARRIEAAGARVVQVNTGAGCHLDAGMVARALEQLDPPPRSLVLIENVGNLVCPALFDLGERAKVLISAVTEGDDKPVKYPHMFRACSLLLLNKIDLLPHVEFDRDRFAKHTQEINPGLRITSVAARRGDGLGEWYRWLHQQREVQP
jgi:hydrogenase nickel incorporation protein HypB